MTASLSTNYVRLADELNRILVQTASPKEIEEALTPLLGENPAERASQSGWSEVRAGLAHKVFTNLFLLEAGLQQTSVITNLELKPPNSEEGALVASTPDELVANSASRAQLKAYRSALEASGKLWNLHQALQAEYSRHRDRAVNLLAELYSQPPSADGEARQLLATYKNCRFATELSNRLFKVQK
jgi:hypothetical protein